MRSISDDTITDLSNKFAKLCNLPATYDNLLKCKNYITSIIDENYKYNEEINLENLLNEITKKYKEKLTYINDRINSSIFFTENNVNNILEKLVERIGLETNVNDDMILKTFVKINMNIIYTKNLLNIGEITESILEDLNNKTVDQCEETYKQQLIKKN
ncbi:hypothetical protein Catovirus_2_205 [Catovirus CTV1]|uniref:Uncharacterized protein n=1 Tax=Catovirus CTV1 TaxID=1977631 RepID=A0A1V0SC24_9VIRU|nr:hypothetical protein Catovirus_2_205 [Catovirus CTV1]